MTALRTWNNDKRCAMCCNGDRCDDARCLDRATCPHCKSTGWALWTEAGRADYAQYLQGWHSMSEEQAQAALARLGYPNTPAQTPQHVLKAEAVTPDATDRGASASTSPGVGPTGAGQPADAGPAAGLERELLELAAKAAGISNYTYLGGLHGLAVRNADGSTTPWSPLTDDGDALRLAAAMAPRGPGGVICLSIGTSTACEFLYAHGPDAAANTRRAIVMAAARIGRAMRTRCPLCRYQHGHQIGCANNPVDIALAQHAGRAA